MMSTLHKTSPKTQQSTKSLSYQHTTNHNTKQFAMEMPFCPGVLKESTDSNSI